VVWLDCEEPDVAAAADDDNLEEETPPSKRKRGVDHDDWKTRHAAVLGTLPEAAQPQHANHGEHFYTVQVALGRQGVVCRIEVHVRTQGYRVVKPKLSRADKPFVPWNGNPAQAWADACGKAQAALDMIP